MMAGLRGSCLGAVSSPPCLQCHSQPLQRDVQVAFWGRVQLPPQLAISSRRVNLKKARPQTLSTARRDSHVVEGSYAGQEELLGAYKQPTWTGETLLAKLVTSIISIKPLWGVMKLMARQVVINGAKKRGVMWRENAAELQAVQELFAEKEALENKSIVYPDYYLQPFHAYDDGNLCWQAAYEVESATVWVACNTCKQLASPKECVEALRSPWIQMIEEHHLRFSGGLPLAEILDVGCSAGVSTFHLAEAFPQASVTGLDLSAYFLAVASYREKQRQREGGEQRKPVKWIHALGEDTKLPPASLDLVSIAFVVHECPTSAIEALISEARRVLRPGGTLAITDNSPSSKVIQNRPLALSILNKSTEPWSDEYFSTDIVGIMEREGFSNVVAKMTDPRHHTLTGTAM